MKKEPFSEKFAFMVSKRIKNAAIRSAEEKGLTPSDVARMALIKYLREEKLL